MAALAAAALCAAAASASRETREHEGPWRLAAHRFRQNRPAMLALYAVITLYVVTALAPWLAPYHPSAQLDIIALRSRPPSVEHLFGTDTFSRDLFSRVLYGARVSLSVALLAVLLSVTL